jgi:anti-sigma regulatory factor (Ser/Thr protein kinase)
VVFEELAANVILHGHPDGQRGEHVIDAALRLQPGAMELMIEDDGLAFDPKGHAGRPLSGPLEDVQIGGLGLLLVRSMASSVDYARTPEGRNRLKVRIRLT